MSRPAPAVPARRTRAGWWRRPWVQVLLVWLAARAFTAGVLLVVARRQVENLWTAAHPSYLDFATFWDGRWYQQIAEDGYPLPVPLDPDGQPRQSPWAFFPAYPALVRVLMEVTGEPFRVVAPLTSLALSAVVAALAYRLFRTRAPHRPALAGVALVCVLPSGAVLQLAYADVLTLAAVLAVLLTLSGRRYGWCLPAVVVLGLSRPVGIPMAAVVLVHLLVRWRHRRTDPLPRGELARLLGLLAAAGASPLVFPLATAWATGRLDGYTAVQDAWRAGDGVRLLTPWWDVAGLLLGPDRRGPALLLLVVVVVAVLAAPATRRLGLETWTWCVVLVLWLAVVVEPWSSLFRQLLPLAPLALAATTALLGRDEGRAGPARSRRARWAGRAGLAVVLVVCLALQVWWVDELWRLEPPSDPPP